MLNPSTTESLLIYRESHGMVDFTRDLDLQPFQLLCDANLAGHPGGTGILFRRKWNTLFDSL